MQKKSDNKKRYRWTEKPRPRLYTPTASSFVSGHDRLVHASYARGIIVGREVPARVW